MARTLEKKKKLSFTSLFSFLRELSNCTKESKVGGEGENLCWPLLALIISVKSLLTFFSSP